MASRYLLDHRAKYPQLHSWLDNYVREAYARGFVQTICVWRMLVNDDTNPRTLRNFPAQANAVEVTRLAVILMVAAGLRPACSIHDAVLVLAPPDRIEADAALTVELMVEASRRLLDFELLVEPPEIVRWPNTLKSDDASPILKFIDPFLIEEGVSGLAQGV
jgi:DNA polymerase-1